MEAKDFVYWLQGMFELSDPKTLDEKQVKMIKNHLKLVFMYDIDPSYTDDPVVQQIFQNIHDGKKPLNGLKIQKKPEKPIHTGNGKVRC
jgi:hypothetical protein